MKVIATSDFHGNLPKIEDKFDLMLICGDICPAHDHYASFQYNWLNEVFIDWVLRLPFNDLFSQVVVIPGNHDFWGQHISKSQVQALEAACDGHLKILIHQAHDYITPCGKELKIFGTSYCTMFGHWAFMVEDDVREKKFAQIPDGIDILMSHQPVTLNDNGTILQGTNFSKAGTQAGDKVLTKELERIKPKYFFSGHIHSGNHSFEEVDGIKMANVSLVDEHYDPVYQPLVFEIDEQV